MAAAEIGKLAAEIIKDPAKVAVAGVTAKANDDLIYSKWFTPNAPANLEWTWWGDRDPNWPKGTTLATFEEVAEKFKAAGYEVALAPKTGSTYMYELSIREPAHD